MKRIRKGNDIEVKWSIYKDVDGVTSPYIMDRKNIKLYLNTPSNVVEITDFYITDNIINWLFKGSLQKSSGNYQMTLVENDGKINMRTIDVCNAFRLVNCSCDEGGKDESTVSTSTVLLLSQIEVGNSSGLNVDLEGYISVFEQDFSEDEKLQARKNIGAVSKEYIVSVFEELKALIGAGDFENAIAILDNAILDLAVLS